jgi:hypothetical protein
MIDFNLISSELVRVAREYVGDYLSFSTSNTNHRIPSIIVERPIRSKPDYPYVTVDLLDTIPTNNKIENISFDPDTEKGSYRKSYSLLYQYTVYGSNKDLKLKAISIAHELTKAFMLPDVRNELQCNACISIETVSGVENTPQQINAGEWLEVALFTLVITTYDAIESDSGAIDKVNYEGRLFRGQDDPNPLPLDITLPD